MTVVEIVTLAAVVLVMGLLVAMLWISQGNVRRWQQTAQTWQDTASKWQATSRKWQTTAERWQRLAESRRP